MIYRSKMTRKLYDLGSRLFLSSQASTRIIDKSIDELLNIQIKPNQIIPLYLNWILFFLHNRTKQEWGSLPFSY
uniref:Putative ovule protein n=1 Tax=Solanum chacoense TaxID=4108 RepID=A0A0V0HEQ5_SOLCH